MTGGGFHFPVRASDFGAYSRISKLNAPFGAGSQLASLSAPAQFNIRTAAVLMPVIEQAPLELTTRHLPFPRYAFERPQALLSVKVNSRAGRAACANRFVRERARVFEAPARKDDQSPSTSSDW